MKEAAKTAPPASSPTASDTASTQAPAQDGTIVVGDTVQHAKFGKGKVLNIEGNHPNEKATVFFPSVGQKQLLLKFAKLQIIG